MLFFGNAPITLALAVRLKIGYKVLGKIGIYIRRGDGLYLRRNFKKEKGKYDEVRFWKYRYVEIVCHVDGLAGYFIRVGRLRRV